MVVPQIPNTQTVNLQPKPNIINPIDWQPCFLLTATSPKPCLRATSEKERERTGRFGKDVSAKTFRQKNFETFRQPFHAETSRIISVLFLFFSTNWLGPVCRIPVCRNLELKKTDKTVNVELMQSIKRASDMSPFPLVPRGPLGSLIFPSC